MELNVRTGEYNSNWKNYLDKTIVVLLIPIDIGLFFEKVYDICFVIAVCIVIGIRYLYIKNKKVNNEKDFKALIKAVPPENKLMIPRYKDARDIAEKIKHSQRFIHVIVGTSGAGKSILINQYLESQLKLIFQDKDVSKIIIDSYYRIETEIKDKLNENNIITDSDLSVNEIIKTIPENKQLFLILDQFEKIFKIKNRENALDQMSVLCKLFDYCQNRNEKKNITCILIMRKETFLNLKFFEDYMPEIKDVHILEGFNILDKEGNIDTQLDNQLNDCLSKLLQEDESNKLRDEVKNKCVRENISDTYYVSSCRKMNGNGVKKGSWDKILLPVEFMTVAKSLCITQKLNRRIEHVDKKNDIRNYFEYYLQSYEKEDTQKIFYALSVSPLSIRSLRRDEISYITSIPIERVDEVLNHHLNTNEEEQEKSIKNFHLVKTGESYDWKHDFFAEQYNEISGGILDPMDRDNINFFWANKADLNFTDSTDEEQVKNRKDTINNIGWRIFYISFIILIIRALYPIFYHIIPLNPIFDYISRPIINTPGLSNFFKNIDASFLPIFITLSLWSYYVTTVYRKILSGLEEQDYPGRQRMSTFVAYWSLLNVILTVIAPCLWIFFTGLGGLFMGLKYKQLTASTTKGKKIKFGENFLTGFGNETVRNSLIMMVIGLVYAFACDPIAKLIKWDPLPIMVWVITLLFFMGLTYFALYSINQHTIDNKVSIFLGLAKRYRFLDKRHL